PRCSGRASVSRSASSVPPRRPPGSPPFPYTTLFRSSAAGRPRPVRRVSPPPTRSCRRRSRRRPTAARESAGPSWPALHGYEKRRSEEHTSELQSRENLVCRLLLEKKKTQREHHQLPR